MTDLYNIRIFQFSDYKVIGHLSDEFLYVHLKYQCHISTKKRNGKVE